MPRNTKGNEAKVELNILKDFVEVFENGESIDQESSYAGWVSQGSWMQEVNSSQNNLGNMGSGQNNQNVRVLQRQPQGNGSRAFWNVLENIYDVQVVADSKIVAESMHRYIQSLE